MKKLLLNPTAWLFTLMLVVVALVFVACNGDDEDSKIAPTVTTAAPTDVTASTATVSGEIVSDGGELVTAAGICYSASNATPTVADDTTKTTVLTGKFANRLKDLASNTTYHVRAYATNSVGTSYGEAMTFTTGNEAPTATNVVINGITGVVKGDLEIDVTYKYEDKEGDKESGTTIQWYRADNAAGANKVAIKDATTNKYRVSDADQGKIIWVGVTPKATTGTLAGAEANSEKKGPVGEATTVTFMYGDKEVTYGIWPSTETGRLWMDRNLGAPNVPSVYNDYANYGDLFQWGRAADGHQLVIRTPNSANPLSGTSSAADASISSELSGSDTPPNSKFILSSADPFDWRNPQKDNLWQGSNRINNPCPSGWHIPTSDEWLAEQLVSDRGTNYTSLKLTNSGFRSADVGGFSATNGRGAYWSSTTDGKYAKAIVFDGSDPQVITDYRGSAYACRCIKEDNN